MAHLARTERDALCDTLVQAGPEAPTLSGRWRAADLAAHLIVREGRPDLAAGVALPPLSGRTERAMERLVRDTPFAELVERVRSGPPAWHPTRLAPVDEMVNLVEMFVHHEDVRRGGDDASPRRLSAAMTQALAARLRLMGPLLARGVTGVSIHLVTPTRRTRLGKGQDPVVEIHGHPGELLLFLFGRREVAEVELVGDPAAVQTLWDAPLGM